MLFDECGDDAVWLDSESEGEMNGGKMALCSRSKRAKNSANGPRRVADRYVESL
jgi:hypothetical protein